MRVGLVIVTYKAEAYIRRALDAVAAQTRLPDEILIHDNASPDATAAAVAAHVRGWRVPVRLSVAATNLGFAAGNNRAVESLPACDLVALLNPDAFPEPGWLAALVAAAAEHPEAASFASRQMLDGCAGQLDGAGDVCHVSGLVWRHGHGRRLQDVVEAQRSGYVFSACGAAALYRRADWVAAGGFDERFFCYVEDVDLGFRLQLAGRRCWYVADAVVHHVGSAATGVGSTFAVYHGHRNLEWLFLKNMPAGLFWRYLPLHVLTSLGGVLHFAGRGQGAAYVRAKVDALRGVAAALRSRAAIQARRAVPADQLLASLNRQTLRSRWRRSSSS